MGTTSPAPSRRAFLGGFAATSATVAIVPATTEILQREFDLWNDQPIVLRRTREGREDSEFRYHNAEGFFAGITEPTTHNRFALLYNAGIVMQLALSSHLLDVGFTDSWCRRCIGLRVAKSLAYANATGLDYHDPETDLLAAILTPYGKWRNAMRRDRFDEGPFSDNEILRLMRTLLDHVRRVTGHSRPAWAKTRRA